jgi:hypothetical protein
LVDVLLFTGVVKNTIIIIVTKRMKIKIQAIIYCNTLGNLNIIFIIVVNKIEPFSNKNLKLYSQVFGVYILSFGNKKVDAV